MAVRIFGESARRFSSEPFHCSDCLRPGKGVSTKFPAALTPRPSSGKQGGW